MDHGRRGGAARIDLDTSADDAAARALYESAGFTNREGGPNGPQCSITSGISRGAE
jgi:hypothetical protein